MTDTIIIFSVTKSTLTQDFLQTKNTIFKILIIFCAIVPLKILEYFCELLGFYCITENVGIYLNAFQLIFDDSKTCQVYGLTYFLSMKYYKITSSVTKSTLTLQKKVQFSIFLYIKIFYSTFYQFTVNCTLCRYPAQTAKKQNNPSLLSCPHLRIFVSACCSVHQFDLEVCILRVVPFYFPDDIFEPFSTLPKIFKIQQIWEIG